MGYNTVIFDLDGTLLDTLDDLMDSCNYALSTIGAPSRTKAEIRRFVGNGIRNLMKQWFPEISVGVGETEGLRRKPERDMVDYALEKLGRTGDQAVYVGDSEVDLATAASAELDKL